MENQTNKKGTLVAIITMMFLFAMIAFVTNMAQYGSSTMNGQV